MPESTSTVYPGSVKLGSSVSEFIQKDYVIAPSLKQAASRALVLDKATVPAILIECGYMDNKADIDFMTNDENQTKIARDILEGIRKYKMNESSFKETTTATNIPTIEADTITIENLQRMDPTTIYSINVDKKNNRIYVKLKSGKENVVLLTKELRMMLDTAGALKKVEFEAEYPGGSTAWAQYLSKSLKYPAPAVTKKTQGAVVVEFIVEANGRITNVHAESGPDALRQESERVIRESGKWIPAKNNGKVVRAYKKQPIIFRLES